MSKKVYRINFPSSNRISAPRPGARLSAIHQKRMEAHNAGARTPKEIAEFRERRHQEQREDDRLNIHRENERIVADRENNGKINLALVEGQGRLNVENAEQAGLNQRNVNDIQNKWDLAKLETETTRLHWEKPNATSVYTADKAAETKKANDQSKEKIHQATLDAEKAKRETERQDVELNTQLDGMDDQSLIAMYDSLEHPEKTLKPGLEDAYKTFMGNPQIGSIKKDDRNAITSQFFNPPQTETQKAQAEYVKRLLMKRGLMHQQPASSPNDPSSQYQSNK